MTSTKQGDSPHAIFVAQLVHKDTLLERSGRCNNKTPLLLKVSYSGLTRAPHAGTFGYAAVETLRFMQIEYADSDLERLSTDRGYTAGFGPDIVKGFRKRIQSIEAALDERDLRNVRGNRYERLKGKRDHEHSMRINDQWRLIFEITPSKPRNTILITKLEDYH